MGDAMGEAKGEAMGEAVDCTGAYQAACSSRRAAAIVVVPATTRGNTSFAVATSMRPWVVQPRRAFFNVSSLTTPAEATEKRTDSPPCKEVSLVGEEMGELGTEERGEDIAKERWVDGWMDRESLLKRRVKAR
jgi:hypothetical protein